jgi:hypothetical protein
MMHVVSSSYFFLFLPIAFWSWHHLHVTVSTTEMLNIVRTDSSRPFDAVNKQSLFAANMTLHTGLIISFSNMANYGHLQGQDTRNYQTDSDPCSSEGISEPNCECTFTGKHHLRQRIDEVNTSNNESYCKCKYTHNDKFHPTWTEVIDPLRWRLVMVMPWELSLCWRSLCEFVLFVWWNRSYVNGNPHMMSCHSISLRSTALHCICNNPWIQWGWNESQMVIFRQIDSQLWGIVVI